MVGHSTKPALRHLDLRNAWQDESEGPGNPTYDARLPSTPLQKDLEGLAVYQHPETDRGQRVLTFLSPFDKAGQVFEAGQNVDGWAALHGYTGMLGRVGMPGPGPGPRGQNAVYDLPTAKVKMHAFHANARNQYADLWHVDAMGWYLPGSLWESRLTYSWNTMRTLIGRGLAVLATEDGIYQMDERHLRPIWQAMGRYAVTGEIPQRVQHDQPLGTEPGTEP